MGDDIGWFNPSCYNRGMMGFKTPNIDRIAAEGAERLIVSNTFNDFMAGFRNRPFSISKLNAHEAI
jgi:hypothetical protein